MDINNGERQESFPTRAYSGIRGLSWHPMSLNRWPTTWEWLSLVKYRQTPWGDTVTFDREARPVQICSGNSPGRSSRMSKWTLSRASVAPTSSVRTA